MTDALRLWYDQARTLFPLLPAFYELNPFPPDDTGLGHVRFSMLNTAGLPVFIYRDGAVITKEEAFHESGHAYRALLERRTPSHDYGQDYWAFRGFPGTYAQAKADLVGKTGMAAWIYDPNESWAEAFRIGVSLDAAAPNNEHTMDFGKTIVPGATRAFFQLLSQSVSAPIPPTSSPIQKDPVVEWQGPVPTSNFTVARSGNPIALIVDHWMGTPTLAAGQLFASALARFMSPTAIVSAHYLIGTTGRIVQIVQDKDTAYHAGDWDTNTMSIGIEHEANATLPPSDALYAASAWLHRKLSQDYGIRLVVGQTVLPHRQVVATACPGTLDLDHIVALATMEEDDMFTDADRANLNRLVALANAEGPRIWTQRLQDWLSQFFKSMPMFANADYKGPDVTSGNPRT